MTWRRNFNCPHPPNESYREKRDRILKGFGSRFSKKKIFRMWLGNWLTYFKFKIFYTYWINEEGFHHRQPRFWKYKIEGHFDLGVWSFGEWKNKDLSFFKTKKADNYTTISFWIVPKEVIQKHILSYEKVSL